MIHPEDTEEKSIWELQGLKEIRNRPDILSRIKFDVTPRMVMKPLFPARTGDPEETGQQAAYMFYIESQCTPPALMVMKFGKADIINTVCKIDDIPAELIDKAMESPPEPPSHGMCAISDDIRAWLKKELGL